MSDLNVVEQKLDSHIKSDEKTFKNITETMQGYKTSLDEIKDNHLTHIKEDINKLSISQEGMKSDLRWIKLIGGVLIIETLGVLTKLLFG